MKRYPWLADWLAWVLLAAAAFSVFTTAHVATYVGRPFGGYLDENALYRDAYRHISAYTPPWWPNMRVLGRSGAALVLIDGAPYRPGAEEYYAAAWAGGRREVELTLAAAGQTWTVRVPIQIFSWSDWLDMKLPSSLLGVSWWLLAALIYQKRPHDPLNRAVAWAFALSAVLAWAGLGVVFVGPPAERLINWVYLSLLWPLTGAALFHLALIFPYPSRWLRRPVLLLIYGAAAVVGAAFGGAALGDTFWGWSPLAAEVDRVAGALAQTGLFSAGIVAVVVRLTWVSLTGRQRPAARRQAGVIWLGLLGASPFLTLFIGQAMRLPATMFLEGLDTRYLLLTVPLAFTLAILRYKSLQVFHPVLGLVAVLTASALLASFGAWGVSRSLGQAMLPLSVAFLPIFAATLGASTVWSTQTAWGGWLSHYFHWERRSYTTARAFGQRLAGVADLTYLSNEIARELVQRFQVEQAAVWLWNPAAGRLELAGQAGAWPAPPSLPGRPAELIRPSAVDTPALEEAWRQLLRAAGITVIAPLWSAADQLGLLGLGRPANEEIFEERDLEIVDLIAQQAALLLFAAQQMAELRQVPARLAETQQRERQRVAQDLHDTVQQRLGGLQLLLETARQVQPHDLAQAATLLERGMNEIETVAQMVRRIRLDLAPPELAQGLTRALERQAERYRQRAGLDIHLRLPANLDRFLPAAAGHEIYLVVGQALDNIVAHAHARHVHIEFAARTNRLVFAVSDDGRGFSDGDVARAQARNSYGLISMEARLASLAGELTITSAPGAGTLLAGWIPIPKALR